MENLYPDKLYTISELQEILKISRATIYRIFRTGKLKITKVHNSTRVKQSDLDAYLS